jgi:hypothetical protein
LASTLLKLRRYDEARQQLERTVECDEPYGHTVEPWKTWAKLADLEQAAGHPRDAEGARTHAIETYLAYRRDGGHSQSDKSPSSP